jgi:hypothetical protein
MGCSIGGLVIKEAYKRHKSRVTMQFMAGVSTVLWPGLLQHRGRQGSSPQKPCALRASATPFTVVVPLGKRAAGPAAERPEVPAPGCCDRTGAAAAEAAGPGAEVTAPAGPDRKKSSGKAFAASAPPAVCTSAAPAGNGRAVAAGGCAKAGAVRGPCAQRQPQRQGWLTMHAEDLV